MQQLELRAFTDITYVWTDQGWAYVAIILDLFSRIVVGWSIDVTATTQLALTALQSAVCRRAQAGGRPAASLRPRMPGHQRRVPRAAADFGVTVSMSRKGDCWDNAVAESFFATLKTELVHRRRWRNALELRAALFEYIEVFYIER